MRAVALALIAAAAWPGLAADPVSWGPAVNGIRLGIGFAPPRDAPALRVLLENVGPAAQEVLVGAGGAAAFRFTAARGETAHWCADTGSFRGGSGLVLPAVVRLEPGAAYERRFPLRKIVCVEKPGDVTFEALAKRRYSFRVSLETDAASARWAGMSHPWTGKVVSPELRP